LTGVQCAIISCMVGGYELAPVSGIAVSLMGCAGVLNTRQESTSVFQTHNSNERRVWKTPVCSRRGVKTSGIVHALFGMTDNIFGIAQVSFGVADIVFGRAYRGFGASDRAFGIGYTAFGAAKKGISTLPNTA